MNPQFVALVRHGAYRQITDAPSALQPFPLTEAGRRHAGQSADHLQAFSNQHAIPIATTIHSSPLLRAWQTAEAITQILPGRWQIVEDARLCERAVGSVANLTIDTIEQIVANDPRYDPLPRGWKSDSDFRLPFPGAESLLEAGQRVATYLTDTMQRQGNAPSSLHIVVGHGAAFRHAAHHLGVLSREEVGAVSMYHDQPVFLRLDPGRQWRLAGGKWKPRRTTDTHTD